MIWSPQTSPVPSEGEVRIVDTDVHPTARGLSPEQLADYTPSPWKEHFYREAKSNSRQANSNMYDPPDSAHGGGMRLDAYPKGGGAAGSDPDLAFQQLVTEAGVDLAILEPRDAHHVIPEAEQALYIRTNNWLDDMWLRRHNRHGRWYGSISVSQKDPLGAAREIERWAGHPRMVQVLITNPVTQPSFGDRSYDPIYAAAEKHGLPVATHVGGTGWNEYMPNTPVGHPGHWHDYLSAWPLLYAAHMMSLIFDGTFERFPELKVVFVEGAFTWALPVVWRMDAYWAARRDDLPHLRRKPSEYVQDHIRFTTQPLEDPEDTSQYVRYLEWLDAGRLLMFSTDYPHWTFDDPAWALKMFPKRDRDRIMRTNALELFRLPDKVQAMETGAAREDALDERQRTLQTRAPGRREVRGPSQ